MTEFRPGRFQILPTIVKNLIIINVLIYLAQISPLNKDDFIENVFALHTWQSPLFKPWQFVTHMFLHSTSTFSHVLFNMFALWMFGSILENLWGPQRFLTFYIVSGLGAALCHMIVLYFQNQTLINHFTAINPQSPDYFQNLVNFIREYNVSGSEIVSYDYAKAILSYKINEATIGASGAVFGCLAAFGYLFPNTYIYLYFFIPIKAKWFVLLYAGYELYATIQSSAGDNVAHVAHLGGALVGFLLVYFWNKTNRRTLY